MPSIVRRRGRTRLVVRDVSCPSQPSRTSISTHQFGQELGSALTRGQRKRLVAKKERRDKARLKHELPTGLVKSLGTRVFEAYGLNYVKSMLGGRR